MYHIYYTLDGDDDKERNRYLVFILQIFIFRNAYSFVYSGTFIYFIVLILPVFLLRSSFPLCVSYLLF